VVVAAVALQLSLLLAPLTLGLCLALLLLRRIHLLLLLWVHCCQPLEWQGEPSQALWVGLLQHPPRLLRLLPLLQLLLVVGGCAGQHLCLCPWQQVLTARPAQLQSCVQLL
jgi:hypothetical protein